MKRQMIKANSHGAEKKGKNPPPNISHHGLKIWRAMKVANIKGNYKNYVLFIGDKLVDRYNIYNLVRPEGSPQIVLVHKSKLGEVLNGPNLFWDEKRRIRTNFGHANYNAPRQAKKDENAKNRK